MRNDQIFVLLLVVLLPMSGCFDEIIPEAKSLHSPTTNETPLLYVWSVDIDGAGQDDPMEFTWNWEISVGPSDRVIREVGVDSDLDGSIDILFNSDGWGLHPQEVIGPSNFTSNNAVHFDDTDLNGDGYCYFAFNLIVIDDAGRKYVQPYNEILRCEEYKTPEEIDLRDYQMYDFEVNSAGTTFSSATGEAVVYVSLDAGDDLPWSQILVQMKVDGGVYVECTNPDKASSTGCAVDDNDDGKWAFGEEVTISEGSDDVCSSGTCEVQIKILDRSTNKLIYESNTINA